jgi:hypothetical protein
MFKAFKEEFDPSKWQKMCYEMQVRRRTSTGGLDVHRTSAVRRLTAAGLYGPGRRRMYLNMVLKSVK